MASRKNTAPIAILLLRLLIFILLLVSLIALVTDNKTVQFLSPDICMSSRDISSSFVISFLYLKLIHRYVLSVAAIGCVYMLLQIPFAAINVGAGTISRGNDHMMLSLIFADMVRSFVIFDVRGWCRIWNNGGHESPVQQVFRIPFWRLRYTGNTNKFFDVAYVSAGFLLIATLCMVIIVFISVSANAKK
ncbi:CASP-like protein 4D1 [Typha angustifolia]|uniref:CASP-like protein 4D1 n=1 Tax=Typha angustifolia TaxID=59011 RepID=UPI003C2DA63E